MLCDSGNFYYLTKSNLHAYGSKLGQFKATTNSNSIKKELDNKNKFKSKCTGRFSKRRIIIVLFFFSMSGI